MKKSQRQRAISFLFSLTLVLVNFGQPNGRATAQQTSSQYFPETGHTVTGTFLDYWNAHGGLSQFGYPISDELQERWDADGQTYTMQYFERALFEHHPENAGTPYEVLLSLLGSQQYLELYGPDGASDQTVSTDNALYFPETHHTIGGPFRTYWEAHGGLMQQGYPISDQFVEVSQLDGKPYTVQYFERSVFELHPENAGTDQEVLLSQLGTYNYRAKHDQLSIPKGDAGLVRAGVSASSEYVVWGEITPPWFAGPPNGSTTIYAFGLHNRIFVTVASVPGGYDSDVDVSVSDSTVVWVTRRDTNDFSHISIMGRDLPSGPAFPISSGTGGMSNVAIFNQKVVWLETSSAGRKVMLKNLATQKLDTIASLPPQSVYDYDQTHLVLSDEFVAWTDLKIDDPKKPVYSVHAYDLKTGTKRIVAIGTFDLSCCFSFDLAISGHSLVWTDPKLRFADLLTGETATLYDGIAFGRPSIRGNTVVWGYYEPIQGGYRAVGPMGLKLTDRRPRILSVPQHAATAVIAGDWLIWGGGAMLLSDAFSGP